MAWIADRWSRIPNPPPDQLEIRYLDIVPDLAVLNEPIALGEAYLAGAGAIGNSFVWAARYMDLTRAASFFWFGFGRRQQRRLCTFGQPLIFE